MKLAMNMVKIAVITASFMVHKGHCLNKCYQCVDFRNCSASHGTKERECPKDDNEVCYKTVCQKDSNLVIEHADCSNIAFEGGLIACNPANVSGNTKCSNCVCDKELCNDINFPCPWPCPTTTQSPGTGQSPAIESPATQNSPEIKSPATQNTPPAVAANDTGTPVITTAVTKPGGGPRAMQEEGMIIAAVLILAFIIHG